MTKITIYYKEYCAYCKFAEMVKCSGHRTVPQIFIGDEYIDGFDDLLIWFSANTFPLRQSTAA